MGRTRRKKLAFDRRRFGREVRAERLAALDSLRDLGRLATVHPATLLRIEQGKVVGVESLARAALAVGLNLDDFIR